jgi:hypothetical protein
MASVTNSKAHHLYERMVRRPIDPNDVSYETDTETSEMGRSVEDFSAGSELSCGCQGDGTEVRISRDVCKGR